MKLISGACFELRDEVEVESPGLLGLGVDQQASAADVISDAEQTGDGVREEAGAQSSAFVACVHAEPGE